MGPHSNDHSDWGLRPSGAPASEDANRDGDAFDNSTFDNSTLDNSTFDNSTFDNRADRACFFRAHTD